MGKKGIIKKKEFLTLLGKAKKRDKRNHLLEYADEQDIRAICECVLNVLDGNVPLSKTATEKLRKYQSNLRKLTSPDISYQKKKSALKQRGGFLPMLIPAALSALTAILGR